MTKKLLFNITEDWFFCSHFLERALAAKDAGYSISVLCKENNHKALIESYGITFYALPFNRKSINPIYEFFTLLKIIFLRSALEIDLPKIGIAFLRMAIASNTPSQIIIG